MDKEVEIISLPKNEVAKKIQNFMEVQNKMDKENGIKGRKYELNGIVMPASVADFSEIQFANFYVKVFDKEGKKKIIKENEEANELLNELKDIDKNSFEEIYNWFLKYQPYSEKRYLLPESEGIIEGLKEYSKDSTSNLSEKIQRRYNDIRRIVEKSIGQQTISEYQPLPKYREVEQKTSQDYDER